MDESINNNDNDCMFTINDLPDEVFEFILSLLPPYEDLDNCMLVSKKWKKSVSNVILRTKQKMMRSLVNFDIRWENVTPLEKIHSITKRYSHAACYYGNSMYVFGGCTCTSTTFNDLWRLDLSTRKWYRQLTKGTYPSPKACATLTHHNGSLLLFGGWTHPSPYPLHQAWNAFNELHIYDINNNLWNPVITPTNAPPPVAGHSATIHKDTMVVFGGSHGENFSSNDIWCFNLNSKTWSKPDIRGTKPPPRYGQSQIALDDNHLLILGGCGGGNMTLNDIWLLRMYKPYWSWSTVFVRNPQWAAPHLWCHPACRVGQYVVVFSRNSVGKPPVFHYSKWQPNSQSKSSFDNSFDGDPTVAPAARRASESIVEPHVVDRDVNVNGRRGSLSVRIQKQQDMFGTKSAVCDLNIACSLPLPSSSTFSPSNSEQFPSRFSSSSGESNSNVSLNKSCDESTRQGSTNLRTTGEISSMKLPSGDLNKPDIKNSFISPEKKKNFNRSFSSPSNKKLEFCTPPTCSGMAAFRDNSTINTNASRQRERQLEALRRVEERLRNKNKEKIVPPASQFPPPKPSDEINNKKSQPSSSVSFLSPKMAMFVLDISNVLTDECYVSWLPIKSVAKDSPDDMILYTLVPGNGELIMFGGIQKDVLFINHKDYCSSVNITNIVSNALHFISPPHNII